MKKLIISFIYFCLILLNCVYAKSLSENTSYPSFCALAAQDEAVFKNFKQNSEYRIVLEHLTQDQGGLYLNCIKEQYPHLLSSIEKFRQNDKLGNPFTAEYEGIGRFSPTTLRYIKVAGDIQREFGDITKFHIVEIGGGYGGQCKILNDLGGWASYTIIDLPEVIALTKKYLESLGIKNVKFVSNKDLKEINDVDLVISNYALSSIDREEQKNYISKVIARSPRGYLTWNHLSPDLMPPDEMMGILFNQKKIGVVRTENPQTGETNQIITWKPVGRVVSMNENKVIAIKPSEEIQENNAITYNLSGGRLGDNLLAYFHGKWLSMKHGIPLMYKPFPNDDFMNVSSIDVPLDSRTKFKQGQVVTDEKQLSLKPSSTLFIVPFTPDSRYELEMQKEYLKSFNHASSVPFIDVDWKDPEFRKEVIHCLTPKKVVEKLPLPKDRKTIAVHVRKGGGFDDYEAGRIVLPLKFPPDNYYISQLKRVVDFYGEQPLYVYIFTDDKNPQAIMKQFSQAISNSKIKWDCGWSDQFQDSMWRDFYSIGKFDSLVCSLSNFAVMASMLGNYDMKIIPTHYQINGKEVVIDGIEAQFDGSRKSN